MVEHHVRNVGVRSSILRRSILPRSELRVASQAASESAMYFVYILESLRTGRFYVGQTDDLITGFRQHQQGLCAATKGYRPWWPPHSSFWKKLEQKAG